MENKKDLIIKLFFEQHLKVNEIAERVNTSSAYITKIIKSDLRYFEEKQNRKDISKENRKIAQNNFMKNKREQKRIDDQYSSVRAQHNKDVMELSKRGHLSNQNYRKWNSSVYNYNPLKQRYEFDEQFGRAADVPKYVKERWNIVEEKLLEVFKLADELNNKNSKIYAEIHYTASDYKELEICIRRKKDFSYVEKCKIYITESLEEKWENIISLFKTFVGGVKDE